MWVCTSVSTKTAQQAPEVSPGGSLPQRWPGHCGASPHPLWLLPEELPASQEPLPQPPIGRALKRFSKCFNLLPSPSTFRPYPRQISVPSSLPLSLATVPLSSPEPPLRPTNRISKLFPHSWPCFCNHPSPGLPCSSIAISISSLWCWVPSAAPFHWHWDIAQQAICVSGSSPRPVYLRWPYQEHLLLTT